MAALAWLLIPLAAILLGVAWTAWATRRRRRVGDVAGVAGYQRFREAMERARQDGARAGEKVSAAVTAGPDGTARTAD